MSKTIKKNSPVLTVAFMMAATLISKGLGMLRITFMAQHYGTGIEAQAFTEASHIPLTIFELVLGAAILGCFIPVYNGIKDENGAAEKFASVFFNTILLVTSAIALFGILFSEIIIELMAGGLDTETKILAVKLLRIMFPMIIFIGSTYTAVGIMQSKGKYMLPAAVSMFSNGFIVIYLIFADKLLGSYAIYGLSVVYVISWFIQLITLAIPLLIGGYKYYPVLNFRDSNLIKSIKMALPVIMGSWLGPLSVIVGLYFAVYVDFSGAVSVFDYSYTTYMIVAGTLTYSICNYAFPLLSKSEGEEWAMIVRGGFTASAAIILPFAAALFILSGEAISVLYLRGKFSVESAAETVRTIRFMIPSLAFFSVIEICNRIFYSKKMTIPPAVAAGGGIIANIIVSFLSVKYFNSSGTGAVGLGYTAGLTIAAAVIVIFFAKNIKGVVGKQFFYNLIKIIIGALLSTAVMKLVYTLLKNDPYVSSEIKNILIAAIVLVSGGAVYFVSLKLFKVKFKKL